METTITATELARSLSDVLNRVKYRGERFVITRNGEPVATLAPPEKPRKTMTLRELVTFVKENWPDEDFARDVMEARSMQTPPRMPGCIYSGKEAKLRRRRERRCFILCQGQRYDNVCDNSSAARGAEAA